MKRLIDINLFIRTLKERLRNLHPGNDYDRLHTVIYCTYIDVTDHIPYESNIFELLEVNNFNKEGITLSEVAERLLNSLTSKFGKTSLNYDNIDLDKTLNNVKEKFPTCKILQLDKSTYLVVSEEFVWYNGSLYQWDSTPNEKLRECFELKEPEIKPTVKLVTKSNYGFSSVPINLIVKERDGNYNDDLPYEKINNLIKSEESSLILFSGEPGTGKSSLIRNLINDNNNLNFLYLDSSTFRFIEDSSFINFLMENRNSIIILEDCESLLESREEGTDPLISTILNLSDGLLGDAFNIKFICTFNTNDTKIDSALLRKGRLKCKYKFEKLAKDKVEAIFAKQGIDTSKAKEMTLAEIYNFLDENGSEKKEVRKIGF